MTTDHFDRATTICQAFERTQEVMWNEWWPVGHCTISSLLLAPLLRAGVPIRFTVVLGVVLETNTHRFMKHCWIEDEEGNIYDCTYNQASKVGGYLDDIRPALVCWRFNELRPHHSYFSLTPAGEDAYRRSIRCEGGHAGWKAQSGVRDLFPLIP